MAFYNGDIPLYISGLLSIKSVTASSSLTNTGNPFLKMLKAIMVLEWFAESTKS